MLVPAIFCLGLTGFTLDLLVRQRGDGDERKLFDEPLVKPIEVFVATRHLDVVKLKTIIFVETISNIECACPPKFRNDL
jgi:hypothetical protein